MNTCRICGFGVSVCSDCTTLLRAQKAVVDVYRNTTGAGVWNFKIVPPPEWYTEGLKVAVPVFEPVCECGAEKCHSTHYAWCPVYRP
jgi:hypothetical protein